VRVFIFLITNETDNMLFNLNFYEKTKLDNAFSIEADDVSSVFP